MTAQQPSTPRTKSAKTRPSESGTGDDVNTPFSPHKDDDSALGDTDQHSTA